MATLAATPDTALARIVQIFFPRGALVQADGSFRMRVIAGRLWITRAGDPRDHFVSAGQSFEVAGESKTFIEADEDTRALAEPVAQLRGLA